MLRIVAVQSFSFKMSSEKQGFPLPVKIEDDQKVFIDLDTEGNSPEDIVIEWHLEIRRFFGSYSADSGEIKLISIMKEYITAITERAIHFEDIVRLQDMVDNHMEHIYWFYRDSDICFYDMYLDYMEHILTFYVNLTLRVLLVLKKKIKVTQKKVNEMTQKVIKRLSFYLLKSECHIFHVLIRQTTSLVDGMIKDVMNILNSNICKQMFRNLYMHFLVLTPVKDMSDEAFCRAYILFENWKAFEDYKQNEKIEECVKKIFNRDKESIRENDFLRTILMPQTSIMSELMKVMGCDPSITKAYFDHVKSKQKGDTEIIDDIGKLALEDALLSETELLTDEDDYETTYMEIFDKIMGDAKYNLNDIVLNTEYCKDETGLSLPGEAIASDDTEILILDTDSDSDVEIVSIVPSLNSNRQVPNTTRKQRIPVTKAPTTTSFLESISIEVDTSRRKYGFRTLGNFDKKTPEGNQSTRTTAKTPVPNTAEDPDSDLEVITDKPPEPCLIIDVDLSDTAVDNKTNPSPTEDTSESVSNNKQSSDVFPGIPSTTENAKVVVQRNASLDDISKNGEVQAENLSKKTIPHEGADTAVTLNETLEEASGTDDIRTNLEESSVETCTLPETEDIQDKCSEQSTSESSKNQTCTEVELIEGTESTIATEIYKTQHVNDAENISIEVQLSALSITSEKTIEHNNATRAKNGLIFSSVTENQYRVNGSRTDDFEECENRDRTSMCVKCRTEPQLDESTQCESDCGKDETSFSHRNNNETVEYTCSDQTNRPSEESTPLDTGQDLFVQPLDTGQFDANSPASPDNVEVNMKNPYNKSEVKVCEPLPRKVQHGEFGYPTPPGSEEERDKDTDDQTKLIYSNILPTQTFGDDENIDTRDFESEQASQIPYKPLTPNNIMKENFQSEEIVVVDHEINAANTAITERHKGDANPSLGESYEQIVKDAVGSQNSTEDEDVETPIICNKDQDISLDEMEQFLKNCDLEDYPQSNRKKRRRPREKTIAEENRSRKNSSVRSPKRVKINENLETHFISTSYDEDSKDDLWAKQNSNDYDSSSSYEEMDSNRPRVKAKRKPSPMPLSKYLSVRNGDFTHIPLSGILSPDKPPPLKGILKRIEQKHTYHPLHPVDDEPETVVIVLHQRDIGRGKRGSVEVKVYRKSFSAFQIPFDDHKLCHHAFVKVDHLPSDDLDTWGKVSSRTTYFKEMYYQPEKPMYKIVFDKKTPQLNSNDRKYYCDPSISSNPSAYSKPKSTLYENEQGTVNLSTEIAFVKTPEPVESIAKPAIQAPISPPCFSPSSNSSSEFSDPTNLISYQDIERALRVVEPENPGKNALGYSLKCQDSNDSIEKSLVDSISLETIELLSNNADFHKMLRDLNGELLLENVPLIGIEGTRNIGNVVPMSDTLLNNDDLVSNLNSDEQLLKKVCQELESKALVDNFTDDHQNQIIITDSFLEVAGKDNCSEESTLIVETDEQGIEIVCTEIASDQICYQVDHEVQVSSFSEVPNNSFSLHDSILSDNNSSIPNSHSKINVSALNSTARYSPPMISPIPDSLHQGTFSSLPDLTFPHSIPPCPKFDQKQSPPLIPPVLTFHQEPSSSIPHFSVNQTSKFETDFSSSNSAPVTSISLVPSLHQQTFSGIPRLPDYTETNFSNSPPLMRISTLDSSIPNSLHQETFSSIPDLSLIHSGFEISATGTSSLSVYSASNSTHYTHSGYTETNLSNSSQLVRISTPLISPVPNLLHQETFSSNPDSSSIHLGYTEIVTRVTSPMPAYSASNSTPQTFTSNIKTKSFLPSPSSSLSVYPPESALENPSSTLPSYAQSNSTEPASPVSYPSDIRTKTYLHNLPATLPTYTETNCLIPNVPVAQSFIENKCTVPSPLSTVSPYFKTNDPLINTKPKHTYCGPSKSSKNAPNCEINSPKLSPCINSDAHILPPTKNLHTKTDGQRKRLPKEVLTISQLNESKSLNIDCMDNNSNWNTSIYPSISEEFVQTKSNTAQRFSIPNERSRNMPLTELYRNTRSRDPRLGQPLICVPPPFIQGPNRSSLVVNLPVPAEMLRELNYKKALSKKNKFPAEKIKGKIPKVSVMKRVANKSIPKAPRKLGDAASLKSQRNVAGSTSSLRGPKNTDTDAPASKNASDSEALLSISKNVQAPATFSGVSKNVADAAASVTAHKNFPNANIPKNDPPSVQFLEVPIDVVFPATSLETPKYKVDTTAISDLPGNVADAAGTSLRIAKNDVIPIYEASRKVTESATSLRTSKKDLNPKNIAEAVVPSEILEEICVVPKSKAPRKKPQTASITDKHILSDQGRAKSKTTGKKRGRPPKNAKSSSSKNVNIPPVTKNIPPNNVITNNYNDRAPPIYHSDVSQRSYPTTRNSTQLRVEPLKIVKDPKSKSGYTKVVNVHRGTPPLPMPVPETYNFKTDTLKKEVYNIKQPENSEIEVEFETHLPLKKRKLSMPVPSAAQAQPTTLANVPRSRDKKEEISYPATPMLSIADVYMQPRTFKTPAEKKQLPPESSAPDTQFNCSLNSCTPAIYGFSKCPYSVELDCNPYCTPPVLFPPESFSHSN